MNLRKKLLTLGLAVIMLVAMTTTAFASEVMTYGKEEKQITITNVLSSTEATPMKPSANFDEVTSYDVTVSTGAKFTGNYVVNSIYFYNDKDFVDLGSTDVMVHLMYEIFLEEAGVVVDKTLEDDGLQAGYTLEFTKPGEFKLFMMDNESLDDRLGFNIIVTDGAVSEETVEETVEEVTEETVEEPTEEVEEPVVEEPVEEEVQVAETVTAVPTASKVLVNGEEISFDAYNIDGNNFFKLRDVATVVNGSEKQFGVDWDNEKSAINLTSNSEYIAVGGELAEGDGVSKTGTLNTSQIYKDDLETELTAYNINGNNYFKLRDLGELFNFGVLWNAEASTIEIDTTQDYIAE